MARQIKVTFKNESKVISETTVESGTQVFSIIKNFNLPEEDIFVVKINKVRQFVLCETHLNDHFRNFRNP